MNLFEEFKRQSDDCNHKTILNLSLEDLKDLHECISYFTDWEAIHSLVILRTRLWYRITELEGLRDATKK